MRIVWAVICETATVVGSDRRLDIVGAGVPAIEVPRLPSEVSIQLALCTAATRAGAQSSHRFTFEVLDPAGALIHSQSSSIDITSVTPLLEEDIEAISRSNGTLRFGVAAPGQHRLLFSLDGETQSEWPLDIVIAE